VSDAHGKPGPVESRDWAERLPAHVASPGPPHRTRGYATVEDLGANYSFAESVLITLGAPPPSPAWGQAANLALIALGATTVADAPVHAAALTARFGSPARVSLAIGMLGLAEQADAHLRAPATDDEPSASLWMGLPEEVRTALGDPDPGQTALALAVLRAAGLRTDIQLLAAMCMARLPVLAAEADAVTPGDLRDYPLRLPDFAYTADP
jgi:hypothetical protein